MGLFAISDLHLSLFRDKPMDMFGEEWRDHHQKLKKNWFKTVTPKDTVLVAGDISWAMQFNEAVCDLDFIHELPGKKIMISGNHDFWWGSTDKLNQLYEGMFFMKNSHTWYEDYAICGSRGWLCPGSNGFKPADEKIYKRELGRLAQSLNGAMEEGAEKIIVMLHYPPSPSLFLKEGAQNSKETDGFAALIRQYPVESVVYGHIHGASADMQAYLHDLPCSLVSCDFLNFTPLRLI